MGDIEIDLQMLEEMCSDIEESAMLLDKDMVPVWMNAVLKNSLGFEIRDAFSDSVKIHHAVHEMYGDVLTEKIKQIFNTGRLVKMSLRHKGFVHVTAIPVKTGAEVLYVLVLLEKMPVNLESKSKDAVLSFLLDEIKNPCFIIENDSLLSFNSLMREIFKDSPAILDYIRHSAPSYSKNFENIKKLFQYSYNISRKPLKEDDSVIGHLYLLEPVEVPFKSAMHSSKKKGVPIKRKNKITFPKFHSTITRKKRVQKRTD